MDGEEWRREQTGEGKNQRLCQQRSAMGAWLNHWSKSVKVTTQEKREKIEVQMKKRMQHHSLLPPAYRLKPAAWSRLTEA